MNTAQSKTAGRPAMLETAIEAAVVAGREIREVYESDFAVEHKEDRSPLTQADRSSHAVIEKALIPFGIPVLSEEGREIPYTERAAWETLWIVDPLDGTKEFVKRNGEFTVNIALVEKTVPVMGVIYVPVQDRLYFADSDHGAYRLDDVRRMENFEPMVLRNAGDRLPLYPEPCEPYTIVGSRSHATEALERFVEEKRREKGTVDFVSAGSSLKICRVAEGSADIYPRLAPTMEWDTAAGQAIAEAAGATLVRHDSGERLTYNREDLLNPWFVVQRQ